MDIYIYFLGIKVVLVHIQQESFNLNQRFSVEPSSWVDVLSFGGGYIGFLGCQWQPNNFVCFNINSGGAPLNITGGAPPFAGGAPPVGFWKIKRFC
jgi:hypothetical protein